MATPAPLPSTVPVFSYLVPWVASTVYPLGVRVTNVGNIYQVATQGTSGNAGGPIGMVAGEADPGSPDGLTWNFIAASAVAWAPSTTYLKGAAVSNDGGRLYQCIAGGTSAGSGGPTGAPTNPNVIGDGTVTWTYIAIVGAQITVPTSRSQDLGPTPGSPLFSQYIAWFFSLVTAWIYYVRDLTYRLLNTANTWVAAQTFTTGSGIAIFGDGSDGSHTLDGAATIAGMAPVANVYTATRDLFFQGLTVNNGISLFMAGFRLYVNGTLTTLGTAAIHCNGSIGVAGAGGAGGDDSGVFGAGQGGAGGNFGAGSDSPFYAAGMIGKAGGVGGAGSAAGGAGTAIPMYLAYWGAVRIPATLTTGILFGRSGDSVTLAGGTGGGGGGGDGAGIKGGGGGGAGGVLLICARSTNLSGTSSLSVQGGPGESSTHLLAGGGGGGGAGAILFVTHATPTGSLPSAITNFTGGAGGANSGGGNAGVAGSSGNNTNNLFVVSV